MKFSKFLIAIALIATFGSCKKDDENYILPPGEDATGALILSEGSSFSGIGSYLGKYTIQPAGFSGDYFGVQNANAELGMNGNDLLIYGSKAYIVMNVSNNVTVINKNSGQLIQRIDFTNSTHGTSPRFAAAANGKVYVSCTSGEVAVLDTTSLAIVSGIAVGSNPEQMAVANNKLFVANSGGFNYPNFDSTVSVIDLSTGTEIQKITVGINPSYVVSDTYGNVFVGCFGDFGDIGPKLVKINGSTHAVTAAIEVPTGHMAIHEQTLYMATGYAGGNKVATYKTTNLDLIDGDFADNAGITTPYGISIDVESGNVWITDAVDYQTSGKVVVMSHTGQKLFEFATTPGVNPRAISFLR